MIGSEGLFHDLEGTPSNLSDMKGSIVDQIA